MNKAIELIKEFEAFREKAYLCPAGVWTIGWGHTGKYVVKGSVVNREQAERWLKDDINWAVKAVDTLVTSEINDNQRCALVSFVFNVGESAFRRSTLLKKVNKNPKDLDIADEFGRWVYHDNPNNDPKNPDDDKVRSNGLVRRRRAEAELYFGMNLDYLHE